MTSLETSRWRVTRLLACCPHSPILDPNPRECPLHDLRSRPLEYRMKWARTRTPDVVERILEFHGWCRAGKTIEDLTADCRDEDTPTGEAHRPGRRRTGV